MSNSKFSPPILKPFQIPFQKCITLGVYLLNWRRARQLCEGWQNFHSKSQFGHFAWQCLSRVSSVSFLYLQYDNCISCMHCIPTVSLARLYSCVHLTSVLTSLNVSHGFLHFVIFIFHSISSSVWRHLKVIIIIIILHTTNSRNL